MPWTCVVFAWLILPEVIVQFFLALRSRGYIAAGKPLSAEAGT
jgi:hypothetical protein